VSCRPRPPTAPLVRIRCLVACAAAAVLLALTVTLRSVALAATSDFELACHWAPVHYQDTDSTDHDADYLTAVDYDGEWSTINNWEDQDDAFGRLTGAVYYSVVETATYWFILYGFYHPRDWCDYPFCDLFDSHENDMEGVLLTVRRNGSTFGNLEAMVTVAHDNFYSDVPAGGSYRNGREDIDGTIVRRSFDGTPDRPTTFQETKGHGPFAWNGGARRANPETFASFGAFRGDNGQDNAANPPWGWDAHDDGGQLLGGEFPTDPAKLVSIYFSNLGSFCRGYLRNGYRS
jgi:hypothetical protein